MAYNVSKVFFSPGGTCARVADLISKNISEDSKTINLLTAPPENELQFGANDVLIIALPVFIGRIPAKTLSLLNMLKGNGAYAIISAVYGNRAYDDALLELSDILQGNGFTIAGASAIIAAHSMFPRVAKGRPDKSDVTKIDEFAKKAFEIVKRKEQGRISVPGNRPYKELTNKKLPIALKTSNECNDCKACAKICPENAIPIENPRITDATKCNNCTACIYVCPQRARKFGGLGYTIISAIFRRMCTKRLEPEFFYI